MAECSGLPEGLRIDFSDNERSGSSHKTVFGFTCYLKPMAAKSKLIAL